MISVPYGTLHGAYIASRVKTLFMIFVPQALTASSVRPINRRASDTGSRARAMRRHAAEAAGGMPEPYRLRAVGHSLGGASLLIYAVMCRQLGRPNAAGREAQ